MWEDNKTKTKWEKPSKVLHHHSTYVSNVDKNRRICQENEFDGGIVILTHTHINTTNSICIGTWNANRESFKMLIAFVPFQCCWWFFAVVFLARSPSVSTKDFGIEFGQSHWMQCERKWKAKTIKTGSSGWNRETNFMVDIIQNKIMSSTVK